MTLWHSCDEYYMARCLELAALGRSTVSPNPMVGAIVLDAKGKKVGEGYHQAAGGPHAEIHALDQAGEAARGGTLYVNLEPCNHTGRTPPCTERIIASGVARVVCGTLDPNPAVCGHGRDTLQNARISVRYGFLDDQCHRLNEIFFHAIASDRPFVALKLAMTLDGRIAARNGKSRWITGPYARQYVHHLRSYHDAVLTTAQTVLWDDPLLTVRDIPTVETQPLRIILDRRFQLDPDRYRIFDPGAGPVQVVTGALGVNRTHWQKAEAKGVRVVQQDDTGTGFDLPKLLVALRQQGVQSLWVEAGGRLAGSLLTQGLVNKLYLFYGPQLFADAQAIPGFAGNILLEPDSGVKLDITQRRWIDTDWVVEATPKC